MVGRERSASARSASHGRARRLARSPPWRPGPDLLAAAWSRAGQRGGRRRARACSRSPRTPAVCSPLGAGAVGGPVRLGLPARHDGSSPRRHGDPRRPGHGRDRAASTGSTATPSSRSPRRSTTSASTPCAGSGRAYATAAWSTTARRACRCASTSSRSPAGSGWMPRCPAPSASPSTSTGARHDRARPGAARAQPARARLLGDPTGRRAARLHLGARHRRVHRPGAGAAEPSTCARTAESPCTCGRPGPWSPSPTRPATP